MAEIVKIRESGSEEMRDFWRQRTGEEPHPISRHEVDLDDGTGYSVILAHEPIGLHGASRWHLSLAHDDRLPEWRHLVAVTHQLLPERVMCVPLPPRDWWINEHEFCLHVWEVSDAPLLRCWKEEGKGDEPT